MDSQPSLFDPPAVRSSSTSRAAAESIQGKSPSLRECVYRSIASQAEHGATDLEVQAALDMDPSTQRPRRIELVKAGRIRKTERTRKTPSGRAAAVYEVAS